MARNLRLSTKRLQIDKANSMIVIAVGIAAFVVAFSLVASKSLLSKRSYHAKVITAREQARDQLETNIEAVDELKAKYREFATRQENIIGGSSAGDGQRDGDNARIVLDALPSKYDFPALVSSIEKILVERNYSIVSISGTDNEATQSTDMNAVSGGGIEYATGTTGPTQTVSSFGSAVEMPFEVSAEGSYKGMIEMITAFQGSIRPMYIHELTFTAGSGDKVELSISGKSFFQPGRTLNITEEVVQ